MQTCSLLFLVKMWQIVVLYLVQVAHRNASFIPIWRAPNSLTNAFQLITRKLVCSNMVHVTGFPSSVWLNMVHIAANVLIKQYVLWIRFYLKYICTFNKKASILLWNGHNRYSYAIWCWVRKCNTDMKINCCQTVRLISLLSDLLYQTFQLPSSIAIMIVNIYVLALLQLRV